MEVAAQNRDEDGEEWSVAYVTVAATKSRKSLQDGAMTALPSKHSSGFHMATE